MSPALKLKRAAINPVLAPHPDHPWENLAVCNPGVWYEDGLFTMIYRAGGFARANGTDMAPLVDRVLGEQMDRLAKP